MQLKDLKRFLKGKIKVTLGVFILFMITERVALAENIMVQGNGTATAVTDAIAIGNGANAKVPGGIAIGNSAVASSTQNNQNIRASIAIGSQTVAGGDRSIAIGYKAGSFVDSTDKGDAILIGARADVTGSGAIVIGGSYDDRFRTTAGRDSIAIGYANDLSESFHGINLGSTSIVKGDGNIVFGAGINEGSRQVVIGTKNTVIGNYNRVNVAGGATKIGTKWGADGAFNNLLVGSNNIVFGSGAEGSTDATEKNTVLGSNNTLNDGTKNNTILGSNNTIEQGIVGSYSLGSNTDITESHTVYIGDGSVASLDPEVYTAGELGSVGVTIAGKQYSFAGKGAAGNGVITVGKYENGQTTGRVIQNLAPGALSNTSTDAINGSQLYSVIDNLNTEFVRKTAITSGSISPFIYTDNEGAKILKSKSGDFYKQKDIEAKGYTITSDGQIFKTSEVTDGVPNEGAIAVTIDDAVSNTENGNTVTTPVDKNDIIISSINPSGSTTTPTLVKNVASALGTATIGNGATSDTTVNKVAGTNEFIDNLRTSENVNTAATIGDLKNLSNTPLFFAGDSGNDFSRKLGEKLTINGGVSDATSLTDGNIGVVSNETDTLTVKLAKNLTNLDTIEATGSITTPKVTGLEAPADNSDATNKEYVDNSVKALGDNTFTLGGDNSSATDTQKLNKDGGLKFNITGNDDIVTAASGDGVSLALQKSTEVSENENKVVTSGAVYNAIKAAKTTVEGENGVSVTNNGNTYTVGLDTDTKSKIDNAADNNLSNITDAGKSVVTDLVNGKADGEIITVENSVDDTTKVKTIQVGLNTSNLVNAVSSTSITKENADNDTTYSDKKLATTKAVADYVNSEITSSKFTFYGNKNADIEVSPISNKIGILGDAATDAEVAEGNIVTTGNKEDGTVNIQLSKELKGLETITTTNAAGDTSVLNADGLTITPKDTSNSPVSLTKDGLNNGGNIITGVKSSIPTDTTNVIENLGNVNGDTLTNAVNLGDLKTVTEALKGNLVDTGFNLKTNDGEPKTVKLGNTLQIVDGLNTKVSDITEDNDNGIFTYHIDVAGLPLEYVDEEGNSLVKIGDKFYKASDVTDGKPNDGATEATPAGTKLVSTTDKPETLGNVASSLGDVEVGNGAEPTNKVGEEAGTNTFLEALRSQDAPKNAVATIEDLQNLSNTPLFFAGDSGDNFSRKLGDKLSIVGGVTDATTLTDNNIGVVANGTDTLTVKLAKNLTNLDTIEATGSITTPKVTGLDTPTKDTDAANKKYVDDTVKASKITVEGTNGVSVTNEGNTYTVGLDTDTKSKIDNAADKDLSNITDAGKAVVTGLVNGEANGDIITVENSVDDTTKVKTIQVGLNTTNLVNEIGSTSITKENAANDTTYSDKKLATTKAVADYVDSEIENSKFTFYGSANKDLAVSPVDKKIGILGDADANAEVAEGNIVTTGDKDNGTIKIQLSKELKGLETITTTNAAGDTSVLNADGLTITPKNASNSPVSLTKDGLNNGGNTITGVKSSLPDNTTTDNLIENLEGVSGDTLTNAVNLGDLKLVTEALGSKLTTTGFKVQTNDGTAETVKLGDTVKVVDGLNTKVSAITADNGTYTYHIDVDGLPLAYADKDGNSLVKVGDKFYKASDITDGKPNDGATEATPAGTKLVSATGTDTEPQTLGNVASSLGDVEVGNGAEPTNKVGEEAGTNTFLEALRSQDAPKNAVATIEDLQNLSNTPLFFAGDSGDNFSRKLGDKLSIVGGVTDATTLTDNNIGVVSNGTGELTVKLAKKLTGLETITTTNAAGDTAELTANGLTITPNGKTSVSLTNEGLNNGGNTITGVESAIPTPEAGQSFEDAIKGIDNKEILHSAVNVEDLQKITAASKIEVKGKGAAVVTKSTEDGHTVYNVNVDKTIDLVDKKTGNGVTKIDGKYYNVSDLEGGELKEGAKEVSPTDIATNLVNPDGTNNPTVLGNVAAGDISANSTDAVNGSQLYKYSRGNYADIASVAAMANIPQVSDNHKFSIGAGVGYNRKEFAFAVGFSGQTRNRNIVYKASLGVNSQKNVTIGAGINYNLFDFDNDVVDNSEVNKLKEKVAELEGKLNYINKIITIDNYGVNKNKMPVGSDKVIKDVAKFVKENNVVIEIKGFTDRTASEMYNMNLGLERAYTVYQKLVDLGVDKSKVRLVSSAGPNETVAKTTGEGQPKNRRVEIRIYNK